MIVLAYVILLAAATPEPNVAPLPAEEKRAPSSDYRCVDGSIATSRAMCPSNEHPAPPVESRPSPPPAFSYPAIPTKSRPARPRNNPGLWVGTMDYPARSLKMEEEGITGFRLTVGVDGRVVGCIVTSSSGSPALDAATCIHITRRARFDPALDDKGNRVTGYYANRVTWRIPAMPSEATQIGFDPLGAQALFGARYEIAEADYPLEALQKGMRGSAEVRLAISATGTVTDCAIVNGSGSELLDTKSCEIARSWNFLPARNGAGEPVMGSTIHLFRWLLPDAWKRFNTVPGAVIPLTQ